MAVRADMQELINYLRQYGAASRSDEFNGETYWSDEQLQEILDSHAQHENILLKNYTGTSWALVCPRHVQFDNAAVVVDGSNVAYSGTYTYNRLFGEILFTAAPTATVLYISGLRVNMWEALADLWARKAQQRFDYVNFKAGNNKMDMSLEYAQCCQQRDYYRNRTIRRYPRVTQRFAR